MAAAAGSPVSARRDLIAVYRSWLDAAGIELPKDGTAIEIVHSRVDGPDEARQLEIQQCAEAGDTIRIQARESA